jgi:hypothetical protein
MRESLSAFRIAAFTCASTMGEQARYLMRELGNVRIDGEYRQTLEKICQPPEDNAWDIPTELDELAALALPDDAPTVRMRVNRIHAWLSESLPDVHQIVRALDHAAATQPLRSSAFVLVAESAAAVINACTEVDRARAQYLTSVGASGEIDGQRQNCHFGRYADTHPHQTKGKT